MSSIKLIHPRKHEIVDSHFSISGSAPLSWLVTDRGYQSPYLYSDLLDINAFVFSAWSIDVGPNGSFFQEFSLNSMADTSFIQRSLGHIVLRIKGQSEGQFIFIPLTVKRFEPPGGVTQEIIDRQEAVEDLFSRYSQEIEIYQKELGKIRLSRERKDAVCRGKEENLLSSYTRDSQIVTDLLRIVDEDEESFDDYLYSEEDTREVELEERFKDAIEWAGPFAGGSAGEVNGFSFRVHSNDHDKHFHVTHRGRGVDARFSFPEIELKSYKNQKNTIGSKVIAGIKEYFKDPKNFSRLRAEFDRRDS